MATRKKNTDTEQKFTDLGDMDMSCRVWFDQTESEVKNEIGVFTLGDSVKVPEFGTHEAAAFDLAAHLVPGTAVSGYDHANRAVSRPVKTDGKLFLEPSDSLLIPTGLVFDTPAGSYVAIHARSGTSLKKKLILTNGVAIIDSDYVGEIFISITNASTVRVMIEDGERVAQAIQHQLSIRPSFVKLASKPETKGNRAGGFGSTGTK